MLQVWGYIIIEEVHMVHRTDVTIKTKYQTLEACRNNCLDINKSFLIPFGISKKIYGKIYEDNTFMMSNASKFGTIFKFEGEIIKKEDGIYLVGDISVKTLYVYLLYFLGLAFNIVGLMIIFSGNIAAILYGFVLIFIGWFYIFVMQKSDILYNNLIIKNQ